jgi:hypothetical protein
MDWTDEAGAEWSIKIDCPTLLEVKKRHGMNLADVSLKAGTAWETLSSDPGILYEVIWTLSRKQAEARGVTAEDFAEAFCGDAMERAASALWETVANFSPAPKRSMLRSLSRQGTEIARRQREALEAVGDEAVIAAAMEDFNQILARLRSKGS